MARAPPLALLRGATFDPRRVPALAALRLGLFRAAGRDEVVRRVEMAFLAALFAVFRRADVPAVRARAVADPFLDDAAFDVPLALRLAMVVSFRNLDSLAISVVLSGAYRKSAVAPQGVCRPKLRAAGSRHPTAGRRSIASRNSRVDRVTNEECARHGKR